MNVSIPRLLQWTMIALTLALLALGSSTSQARPAFSPDAGRPDEAILAPESLVALPGTQSDEATTLLSPVTTAAHPFSYMLLRWQATNATTDTYALEARASADGNDWSPWRVVLENPDLWQPTDGPDAHWSQTIFAGKNQRFYQTRLTLRPHADGSLPNPGPITVSSITPTARQAAPGLPQATTQDAPGKPVVISRSAWGCPDGQNSRANPAYYRVNHMVVHHTADQNALRAGESDWGDRVRAEWSFHTFTRGWGDVGYNFLIDPNGVIYEGRAGGDDAVGFHDTGNYGSMGVVLIGTFSTQEPRQGAQDSLVELLAWKAANRGIDPLGRSYYYGCDISDYCTAPGAVIANIAPHRHVNPTTSCPGDALANLLPTIRERVKDRMGGGSGGGPTPVPDNGDLQIDELEQRSFARSDATWYAGACGSGDHTYYSFTTDDAADATNSATWRPTIKEAGTYRVYAHIPQGCGLFDPPYATRKATYKIRHTGGVAQKVVDQNSSDEWADLGLYSFASGTDSAVELYDYPGEPYSQRKVLFFDSVKWVPEEAPQQPQLELTGVRYGSQSIAAGELLKVTFTVKNVGNAAAQGQAPAAAQQAAADSGVDTDAYAYDEGECFGGDEAGSYSAFPKERGRFRLLLGPVGKQLGSCKEDAAGYPWRWGLKGSLAPGASTEVVGYVRFRTPGTYQLQAGGIQEFVDYFAKEAAKQTLVVTKERVAPAVATYDEQLQPLATVYRLGEVPDNLLARTSDAAAVPREATPIGSFPWYGDYADWKQGGPLTVTDNFVVEQTRLFTAPVSGNYGFKVRSDDGAWLWVDGQAVVVNNGLHSAKDVTGTLTLSKGLHTLSLKYFERSNRAGVGYWIRYVGAEATDWQQVQDALAGEAREIDGVFLDPPTLTLAAADLGGSGVERMRYSLDAATWIEEEGPMVTLGKLVDGTYTLRYQAIDAAGNASPEQSVAFSVDQGRTVLGTYTPLLAR